MAQFIINRQPFRVYCEGYPWDYTTDGILCVDCKNSTVLDLKHRCTAEAGKAIIPANLECQHYIEQTPVFNVTRFTSVFTVKQHFIIGENVPKISSISVIPAANTASITINTTCIFPGCRFYCAGLPVGTIVTSARMMISQGWYFCSNI